MDQRIVYKTPDGALAMISPTAECLEFHTIQEIADKDVPEGLAYKIVNAADIPADRTFRDAWDIDEAELTDGVGAAGTEFTE